MHVAEYNKTTKKGLEHVSDACFPHPKHNKYQRGQDEVGSCRNGESGPQPTPCQQAHLCTACILLSRDPKRKSKGSTNSKGIYIIRGHKAAVRRCEICFGKYDDFSLHWAYEV